MRTRLTVILAISLMGLAACNNPQHGSPSTPEASSKRSSNAATTSTSWPSELPRITDPVDVAPWMEHPCDVLTEQQLDDLDINTKPEPGSDTSAPSCKWGDLFDDQIVVDGDFGPDKESTIPGLYHNNELGRYAYFDPVAIKDYPAVLYGISDDRDIGGCGMAIALRKGHTYVIGVDSNDDYPSYDEPCTVVKDVAEKIVTTMTEGGS